MIYFSNPPLVFALETYQDGSIILSDDFGDGNFNGWTVESGTWIVDSAKQLTGFTFGSLKFTGRIGTGSTYDNYRLELDVRNDSGVDEGIGFRRADANNTYEITLRHGTGLYNTPEVILAKVQNGVNSQLFSTHSIPLVNSKSYRIKVEVVESHIQMWIDSVLVFDLDDPNTSIKKGGISLSYWTGDVKTSLVRFDNVKLTSLSKLKYPVIFIPGIGGSEFKTNQDIVWSKDNGHGGIFSHAYPKDEKIWVNESEAAKLGDDDYFDILKLKDDGVTSEADLILTGNLTSQGYGEIDSFFSGAGYTKGTNFFIFPYDWRKDIRHTTDSLNALIDEAKTKSGQPKVNIVAHSMGGLVARNYISDISRAGKVNKLIELGVPHLGAVDGLKLLLYGKPLGRQIIGDFYLGIPSSEAKDVSFNSPSAYQLNPSAKYFEFYPGSDSEHPYPFRDDRDIDANSVQGLLSFDQIKNLFKNLGYNMKAFNLSEEFHNTIDPFLSNTNNVKSYLIVGSSQPTLGQIRETWLVSWPVNLIPRREEIFINGDNTVPLYSASLKSNQKDLSANSSIYYVDQKHSDLVSNNGTAMQTVKAILNEGDALPVEVKSEKITLEGKQISIDDGELDLYDSSNNHTGLNTNNEVEINVPGTFYSSIDKNKTVFIKKKASTVKVKTSSKTNTKTDIKIRNYSGDKVTKTIIYKEIPVVKDTPVEFNLDPASPTSPVIIVNGATIPPTSEVEGDNALDQTAPVTTINIDGTKDSSGNYTGSVTVTIASTDSGSGILKIEYSLDNGKTVQNYTTPFTVTTAGLSTLQVKSIDKLGNEELPQTVIFTINPTIATTTSSTSSSSSNSSVSNSATTAVSTSLPDIAVPETVADAKVLGITFSKSPIPSAQIKALPEILGTQTEPVLKAPDTENTFILAMTIPTVIGVILSGLFMFSFTSAGGILLTNLGSAFKK